MSGYVQMRQWIYKKWKFYILKYIIQNKKKSAQD